MAKEWAKPFYNSKAWIRCRAAYIKSMPVEKRGMCERCYTKGLIVPGYILHHIKKLTLENINNPRIALSFSNLEFVCKSCHDDEHGVGASQSAVQDGLMFDDDGQLVEVSPP